MRKNYPYLFLLFVSAITYLPFIAQFGYYRDDWYLMYSANALGGDVFHQIYASDRPLRAYVMSLAYSLFGLNPLYYNLSAYLFRFLGGVAFFYTLEMIWKEQRKINLVASVLLLIFPGFLSTPNAIDYQSQQLSLFLALLSIALSIKTLLDSRLSIKILNVILIALLSFFYLGLIEYFLGLEVFRLGLVFLISYRKSVSTLFQKIRRAFLNWLPFSIGSILFILWRFFIFDSERKATDLGSQLGTWMQSPLLVSIEWGRILLRDIFEVTLLAWWMPLSNLWNISLRLREVLFLVLIVGIITWAVIFVLKNISTTEYANSENTSKEMFWVGLIVVMAGFAPVILSNRDADFYGLSRYMLASSVGSVILISAFLSQLKSQKVYVGIACLLIVSSVLMHNLNGLSWKRSSQAMQNFWWQVSWRIPQIRESTTLVVNYSHTAIEEDYFIWGPANFIYYPESKNNQRVEPMLWGLILNRESTISILNHAQPEFVNRRSIITYFGYDNILILTQPSASSCVQVIDGVSPIVSEYEQYDIQIVASESNQNNIVLDETHAPPPDLVFGSEPQHEWCFYYQKAVLAFQQGDYEKVLELKQNAEKAGFTPQDPVEWMPFLQASILLSDYDEAIQLSRFIKKSSFLQLQACENLPKTINFDQKMKDFTRETFCIN